MKENESYNFNFDDKYEEIIAALQSKQDEYDDIVSDDEFVTLPHPLMEDREFVLKPLNEIAPNYIHPLLKKRVFRLLRELKSSADK